MVGPFLCSIKIRFLPARWLKSFRINWKEDSNRLGKIATIFYHNDNNDSIPRNGTGSSNILFTQSNYL